MAEVIFPKTSDLFLTILFFYVRFEFAAEESNETVADTVFQIFGERGIINLGKLNSLNSIWSMA